MVLGADSGVGRFVGGEVEVCAQAHTRVSEARESARRFQSMASRAQARARVSEARESARSLQVKVESVGWFGRGIVNAGCSVTGHVSLNPERW